jgi:hypothetical protein
MVEVQIFETMPQRSSPKLAKVPHKFTLEKELNVEIMPQPQDATSKSVNGAHRYNHHQNLGPKFHLGLHHPLHIEPCFTRHGGSNIVKTFRRMQIRDRF